MYIYHLYKTLNLIKGTLETCYFQYVDVLTESNCNVCGSVHLKTQKAIT